MPASLWALTSSKMGAAIRAKFLVMAIRDGSIGSALGLMRLPNGRGVGREGDGDTSVPDTRFRLLLLRPASAAAGGGGGGGRPSLRPLRRPEDLCSLSDANGAGVEGVSCLISRMAGLVSTARSGRFSEVTEARD